FTESLVWNMAFSPSGQVLAVGTLTGTRLWDAKTGKILQTLQENSAESVAFSPGGKTLACSQSASATLWDTETGELLQALNGHTDSVVSVAFSPQGRTLASLSLDGTVLLWEIIPDPAETDSIAPPNDVNDTVDISGYTTTRSLPEGAKTRIGKGTLLDMQYTPEGKYLKVTSSVGRRIYDAETYQELGTQAFPKPIIGERTATDITQYVVISPDGTTVARQTENRRLIHLWDVETNTPLHTITGNPNLRDHLLAFSPDGKKLVIGNGAAVYLWDVATSSLLHTFADTYSQSYYSKNYCFSPDGTMLAVGNPIHIRLWDVERGNLLHTFVKRVNHRHSIAFSPDGKTLATGVTDGNLGDMIHIWDVETETFLRNLNPRERTDGSGASYSLAFSSDGRTVAAGQSDGKISLWSVGTGVFLRATPAVANSIGPHPILKLAFSSDGETLAAGVEDGTLRLYAVKTAAHLDTIGYMPSNILSIAFSPDGKMLAIGSGSNAGAISLWNTESSTLLHSFRADLSTVHSVVFSPDGKTLVSGGGDNHLRLWSVETGNLLEAFPPQLLPNQVLDHIHDLSFSPDDKTLAIVQDEFIDLRDMETDTVLCRIGFPNVNFSDARVAFSPDGKKLVIGHFGRPVGIIRLFDVEKCSYLHGFSMFGFGDVFPDITFSPDGNRLMALTGEGLWILRVEETTRPTIAYFDISPRAMGTFSPDRKMLATGVLRLVSGGFEDSSLYVWNANTGELIRTYESGPGRSLVFSPDSTMLASEGGDGTVVLWELTASTEPEPESLTADVNGDGEVNIQDLVAVAAAIGQAGENDADVNGDGQVNIQDLVAVAAALGEVAAAPAVVRQPGAAHLTQEEVQHWLTQAQQADLTDATSVRGIRFLKQLLSAFTPKETALLPNYPNPFNPETWIPYQLAEPADVALTIYDINGRVVRDLDLGHQRAGLYHARSRAAYWDGRNAVGEPVASGVYFYTLTAGEFTATRKMLILK
ncbi:MAG: T9SS type A sorting domain-containing protein, partial [Candidatus Poribacteria bacterium]|nr:T9SS type A sorting domain-containing protein [Candidatus Poribacteria bacterium]